MLRIAAALALLLNGCTLFGGGGPVPAELRGDWLLVDGRPARLQPLPEHPVTLTLEAGAIGGTAACNSYGAEVSWTGSGIELEDGLAMTAMGCEPPVQALEQAYAAALEELRELRLEDGQLVARGPGIQLRFERLTAPDLEAVTGIDWVATAVVVGGTRSALGDTPVPVALRLGEAGALTGTTGCRSLTGRWDVAQDRIVVPELAADGECPAEFAELDAHVVTVVGDGFRPEVVDGTLTLRDPGGDAIVYEAADG